MKELIIYKCPICGNMAVMLEHSGVNPVCCGKPMQMLLANKQEASFEKHIPVVTQLGRDVSIKIGEDAHPMTEDHSILWIALLTDRGLYTRELRKSNLPEAYFSVNMDEDVLAVWIIAAVIANISVLLVSLGWNGFGLSPVIWTCIILVVGAFIGALPVLKDRKWFSTLAVIWAYAGILIRHIGQDGYAGKYPFVIGFAIIGIVIMLSAMLIKAVGLNCSCKKTINE